MESAASTKRRKRLANTIREPTRTETMYYFHLSEGEFYRIKSYKKPKSYNGAPIMEAPHDSEYELMTRGEVYDPAGNTFVAWFACDEDGRLIREEETKWQCPQCGSNWPFTYDSHIDLYRCDKCNRPNDPRTLREEAEKQEAGQD